MLSNQLSPYPCIDSSEVSDMLLVVDVVDVVLCMVFGC